MQGIGLMGFLMGTTMLKSPVGTAVLSFIAPAQDDVLSIAKIERVRAMSVENRKRG